MPAVTQVIAGAKDIGKKNINAGGDDMTTPYMACMISLDFYKLLKTEGKIFAVDFDGVLFEEKWPDIGKANEEMIAFVKKLSEKNKIILWTCRCGAKLYEAVKACREHGLEFFAINENTPENVAKYGFDSRKIFADYYIDDRIVPITKRIIPSKKLTTLPRSTVFEKINDERNRQETKYGRQSGLSLVEWMSILFEEVGEASKEVNDYYFEDKKERLDAFKMEMIQVAAVAVQILEFFVEE